MNDLNDSAMSTLAEPKEAPHTIGGTLAAPLNATPQRLGAKLRENGRNYTLVERVGNVAIYSAPICDDWLNDLMYEVIVIRTFPAQTLPSGMVKPFREAFPKSEDWGASGWTFTRNSHLDPLASARAKLNELTAL